MELSQLLVIKQQRQHKAALAVSAQQQQVNTCKQRVKHCEDQFEQYQQWRLQEEQRLWDEASTQIMKRVEIDRLKTQITLLRDKENQLQEKTTEAKQTLEKAEQQLIELKAKRQQATQAEQRLDELVDQLQKETHKADQYKAEQEQEEVSELQQAYQS